MLAHTQVGRGIVERQQLLHGGREKDELARVGLSALRGCHVVTCHIRNACDRDADCVVGARGVTILLCAIGIRPVLSCAL